MKRRNEQGAIVIEATLSLTAFVFVLFTILSIVNIFYIQAKMSVALNSAAKDIAQYSYLYYKFGIDELDAGMAEGTEESREMAEQTIDGVGSLLSSFSDAKASVETADFDSLVTSIENGAKDIDGLVQMYGDKLADDPKEFILGMGKMAGNELKEEGKALLGQVLATAFMKKNLMAYQGDNPDDFLKRYRVVNGMSGLNFKYTALFVNGKSNQFQLVVTYEVEVIKFLNIDVKFKFRQCAKTTAWGNGISLINPEKSTSTPKSVWDNASPTERGKIIVLEEKKDYKYTSSGNGFDAYNNDGGANEFITITSVNTHDATYSSVDGIRNRLSSSYSDMYDKVERLGEEIYVQNKAGLTETISSEPSTRTYKIILVVPEDADLSMVQQAVAEFEASREGVVVEIKPGYGSPTPPKEDNKDEGSESNSEET